MDTRPTARPPLDLRSPFRVDWAARNSPASRVPSHGTHLFGTAFALDLVPVDGRGRTAPVHVRTLLRTEPPERFPGFGALVLAPVAGRVVAAWDGEPDHDAHRGLASLGYALTQGRRAAQGFRALAGNHVMLEEVGGAVVALCHLQRGTLRVAPGDEVRGGQSVGACGNSGNSMEPHLHLQAMDGVDPERALPLPFTIGGRMPRNGEITRGLAAASG